MKIAATAVGMDAACTYKDVEQRCTGLSMGTEPVEIAGQTELFGIRLATMLASSTQTTLNCRSEVSRADGGSGATFTGGSQAAGTESALAQLAGQVIGQPVTLRASETTPSSSSLAQAASPLFGVRTASLVNGVMYTQEESLLFSAQGTVQTGDGREIAFDLGLSMERRTVALETASMEVSTLFIDPLMLQFDLDSPLLGDSTFLFDLDSDGVGEDLACPGSGCGFLAFDRNSDGRINNGLELFGPESGSGFGELADLDSDANLWIDENDPVFDQLLIWSPDGQGGESLKSLREAGVGAIAVTNAGTGFRLEKGDGTVLGTIKASGIFLTESGEVRPLQEVDLALSGTQPDIGSNGEQGAGGHRLEAVLQSLREIISMQRLRLRTMLTAERLRRTVAEREEQQQLLSNWLQGRNEWQARIESRLEDERRPDPFAWAVASARKNRSVEAGKFG